MNFRTSPVVRYGALALCLSAGLYTLYRVCTPSDGDWVRGLLEDLLDLEETEPGSARWAGPEEVDRLQPTCSDRCEHHLAAILPPRKFKIPKDVYDGVIAWICEHFDSPKHAVADFTAGAFRVEFHIEPDRDRIFVVCKHCGDCVDATGQY